MTDIEKLGRAVMALKRICDDAECGIEVNDHELMNPDNFKREMDRHLADKAIVLDWIERAANGE